MICRLTRRGKTKFATLKWYNWCQQIIQSQTCYPLNSQLPSHPQKSVIICELLLHPHPPSGWVSACDILINVIQSIIFAQVSVMAFMVIVIIRWGSLPYSDHELVTKTFGRDTLNCVWNPVIYPLCPSVCTSKFCYISSTSQPQTSCLRNRWKN